MIRQISIFLHLFPYKKLYQGFLGGSLVKNLPANAGDQVQSLGWEDLLGEEMATHYNILTWTEKPRRLQSVSPEKLEMTYRLNNKSKHHQLSFVAVSIKLKEKNEVSLLEFSYISYP